MSEFSVIIPTLQRAAELHELVEQCAAHPLVLEVLVINNAPEPLAWESPKVRVLQQAENIYVNPAWNLGAREARGKYLAIINDDLLFDPAVFDYVGRLLSRPAVGMVGPDGAFMNRRTAAIRHRLATEGHIRAGVGVFLAMKRRDYAPIPEGMLIWGGDDWLFWNQRHPSRVLLGGDFRTEMGTTSSSNEFRSLWQRDSRVLADRLEPVRGHRWWHRPAAALASLRKARARLRQLPQRERGMTV